ncbi:AMP-binding protein [Rhodoferax ferrireducens]|nr:AMP-binding protein [Rhodoferax ferrireducens]
MQNVVGKMITEVVVSPWKSKQDRRQGRSVKKDAVLLAAARLFNERGFAGTSLDDIAQSLNVTKPTLYYYIENKEQVLFECVKRGLEVLRESIRAATQHGLQARDCLRIAMENYAEVVTSDFGLCVIRVGEDPLSEAKRQEMRALKREIDAEFHQLIEQGMDEGWIAQGDSKIASFTVVGALSGIGRWYRPGVHGARSLQEAVQHCIEMLMHGALNMPTHADSAALDGAVAPNFQQLGAERQLMEAAMPQIRRELHSGGRMIRCFYQRPSTIAEMLIVALEQNPDGEALVVSGLHLTWRELYTAATRCAAGLSGRGVAPGERVAMFMANCSEFVIATYACAWIGAVVVPINARARTPEVQYILEDSGATVLLCASDLAQMVPATAAVPGLMHRFVAGPTVAAPFESFSVLMQESPLATPTMRQEEDLAALLYTSGTTGKPKGAMLSHLNIVHSAMNFALTMQLTNQDRSMLAVPMNHVTGLVGQLYTMLYCQGCVVVMPQFKALEFARLAALERITHTVMVPAMYNLCLLLPGLADHDLSRWRIGAFGGSPMPPASIEALARKLPTLALMNAYGATETSSPAAIMPADMTNGRTDSVGITVPCGEICVVDETGCEMPHGKIGELWIKGPMVVGGYWNNPEATATEFCDGYWRSGDIGTMDTQGFVRILDRKKDVINRGGYKVFCAEVENLLAQHSAVIESAVVGVPCSVLGERVHAFVCVSVLDDSTQAQAFQALCSAELSDYKVPETWTIGTDPLPRNPNGKVMKRELRRSMHAALT